jgi:thiamine kinase-like enzyme
VTHELRTPALAARPAAGSRAIPAGSPAIPAGSAQAILAGVPSLAGTPRQVTELPGGLTNQNFKVTTPDGIFVARLFSDGGELLAIDREHEYRNSLLAAAAGVGAPVIEYRPDERVLVLGFVEGRTLTNADVAEPAMLTRIARACRTLHGAGRFAGDFDMFEVQAGYYATAKSAGMSIPAGYDELMPAFTAARSALAAGAEGTVPCNNDLLAANFIDDGERIWLIDYEYSGNNDPCFELGNIGGECGLDDEALAALVTAYYGTPRPGRFARAKLFGLVARYGWTLWGAIRHHSSQLDFDFWSWAMERFEAAAEGFTSTGYSTLLSDAQDRD